MQAARRPPSTSLKHLCLVFLDLGEDLDIADQASSRILTRSASKKTRGYIGSSGRFCHSPTVSSRVRDRRDQVGRDIKPVDLHQMALDLPNRHAAGRLKGG
jgi:hypothetical protein